LPWRIYAGKPDDEVPAAAYPLSAMTWNEQTGAVTRAFDDWSRADREIRAYLKASLQLAQPKYDRLWDESMSSTDEDDDLDASIEGLNLLQYEWMLFSSVVKDAVTAFEVYMEKAADEVLKQYGLKLAADAEQGRSPEWRELIKLYGLLGAEIETEEVKRVLALRHVLTHQRGDLRTKKLREDFGDPEAGRSQKADLTQQKAIDTCDSLAAVVRRTDPIAYEYAWGSQKSDLLADIADMGITWQDVPRITRRRK
jgi:hypothetical protein